MVEAGSFGVCSGPSDGEERELGGGGFAGGGAGGLLGGGA